MIMSSGASAFASGIVKPVQRSRTFMENIMNNFVDLQQRQVDCDLDLICKNGLVVKCHRLIMGQELDLSLCQQPPNQPHSYYLVLEQFSADMVKTFVKYCYTGSVEFCVDEAPQLISLCHFVKSKSLADLARNFLVENIRSLTLSQIKRLDFQSMKYVILEGQLEFVECSKMIIAWMRQDPAGKQDEYVQLMDDLHFADEQRKEKQMLKIVVAQKSTEQPKKTQQDRHGGLQKKKFLPMPSSCQSRNPWH